MAACARQHSVDSTLSHRRTIHYPVPLARWIEVLSALVTAHSPLTVRTPTKRPISEHPAGSLSSAGQTGRGSHSVSCCWSPSVLFPARRNRGCGLNNELAKGPESQSARLLCHHLVVFRDKYL